MTSDFPKAFPKDSESSGAQTYEEKNLDSHDSSDYSSLDEADRHLAKIGYKPELKREFTLFSAFSFAVSISGLFATVATTYSYPLVAGGASSVVWSWFVSGAGCMCIALSVAELVSAYPTSGGLYFTISSLAPKKIVPVISWFDANLNLLGQIAGIASTDWGAAALLLAAVSMGSNFTYVPTNRQTVGVMAALLVFHGAINSMSTKALEKITNIYVVFHVLVLISGCIALLACQHDKHDAKYVFTHVENGSGWTPDGWAWMFGFLSVSWTMTDYDATAHICEEMEHPETKAPWAISAAMGFTYIAGFLLNIVLAFCMGDPAELLASPIAQPVAQIFYNVLGKGGGLFFTIAAFLIMNFVAITAIHSCSRTVWAFSRDDMMVGSKWLYKVNGITKTPLIAVWFTTILCIAINLIGLGSYITISAIFNVCAIALDWSYCIPILCKLLWPSNYQKGPWNLGKFSTAINLWAVLWTLFVSIIFFCPTEMPVKANNMNYAIVFFIGVIVLALVQWIAWGRKTYKGPKIQSFQDQVDL